MTFRWIAPIAAGLMLLAGSPAQAEWLKATSPHFVVYSDTNEKALRRQATELERFDAALRVYFRTPQEEDPSANRLTVYVVPDAEAVQKVLGRGNVTGFYLPRVTGSVAFTPRVSDGNYTGALGPRTVLFHEYGHHFLYSNRALAYPMWYSEGFAEFVSTAMERDGGVWFGAPANHRGWGLLTGNQMPLRQLLAPSDKLQDQQGDALYGRGWLFTHYLMFNPVRSKQFAAYLQLFNAGRPSVDAATEAFGDLRALEADLDRYLERNTTAAYKVAGERLGAPTVEVRPLTAGERALIAMRMESERGVDGKTAPALYARAKAAAAPYRTDPGAQGWLAEMAYDAGDFDAAEAAADAALAATPTSGQALLYKARAQMARAAKDPKATAKGWAEARSWIIKANRANPNDPAALSLYYDSFGMEGIAPTKVAVAGLYRANDLAPQDRSVSFSAAHHYLLDGETGQAKRLLRSLASDPHAGAKNPARRLLGALDAGKTGAAAIEEAAKAAKAEKEGQGKDGG